MLNKPELIICDKCGGKYGAWDYRKCKHRRMPICKACEAEKKAQAMRKKQEVAATNHLAMIEVNKRTAHNWEQKATARIAHE